MQNKTESSEKKTGCLLLHEMYTYYLWKRPVSRYYDKRYSGYYFSGVPEDVADTYREIVGIDLYISGKQVSAATSLAILLIFGLIFLMIGVVVLRHEKRSDR